MQISWSTPGGTIGIPWLFNAATDAGSGTSYVTPTISRTVIGWEQTKTLSGRMKGAKIYLDDGTDITLGP